MAKDKKAVEAVKEAVKETATAIVESQSEVAKNTLPEVKSLDVAKQVIDKYIETNDELHERIENLISINAERTNEVESLRKDLAASKTDSIKVINRGGWTETEVYRKLSDETVKDLLGKAILKEKDDLQNKLDEANDEIRSKSDYITSLQERLEDKDHQIDRQKKEYADNLKDREYNYDRSIKKIKAEYDEYKDRLIETNRVKIKSILTLADSVQDSVCNLLNKLENSWFTRRLFNKYKYLTSELRELDFKANVAIN